MITATPRLPAARPPRVAAPARGGDALADGLRAESPEAFRTALIRLAAEARDAEVRAGRTRDAFERDEVGAPALRAAEADLARAYDRLRSLRASVEGSKGAAWVAAGFDLDAVWARHGVKLPATPRRIADRSAGKETARQLVGAAAFVGGIGGFAVYARAASASVAAIGFGAFVLSALVSGALLLIDHNRR